MTSRSCFLAGLLYSLVLITQQGTPTQGGAVVSWLVCSTPERMVRVSGPGLDIVLCS